MSFSPGMKSKLPPPPKADDKNRARARRKQAAVRELIRQTGRTGRQSLGMIEDTPVAREAFALGAAYRRAQTQL